MKDSVMMFIFSVFDQIYPFLGKFGPKSKLFVVVELWHQGFNIDFFSFFLFLDWKHHFLVNLVQKLKIWSSRWNLIPRLFLVCKIWCWWWSLFYFGPFFSQKIRLGFWCYLINLAAVYSERLEASGFSCWLNYKTL